MPSLTEILVILVLLLVVVGPERLPQLARKVGEGVQKLRRTTNMFRDLVMLEDQETSYGASEPPGGPPTPIDQQPVGEPIDQGESSSEDERTVLLYPTPLAPTRSTDAVEFVDLEAAGPTTWTRWIAVAEPHRTIS